MIYYTMKILICQRIFQYFCHFFIFSRTYAGQGAANVHFGGIYPALQSKKPALHKKSRHFPPGSAEKLLLFFHIICPYHLPYCRYAFSALFSCNVKEHQKENSAKKFSFCFEISLRFQEPHAFHRLPPAWLQIPNRIRSPCRLP